MDKNAIRNFALHAHAQLTRSIGQCLQRYGVAENGDIIAEACPLTAEQTAQRQQLAEDIRRNGWERVVEETAYAWFYRLIALRYMEVNGCLPCEERLFADESGQFCPTVSDEDGYRRLLIVQCRELHHRYPSIFDLPDERMLLLSPTDLSQESGVIGRMVTDIREEDFQKQVEILGWLYQFYSSEQHKAVIDPLYGKVIEKEDIPVATQLFTTDWVVRYILDNSLGRYWLERHPDSRLAQKLTYRVTPKSGCLPSVEEPLAPDELKVLDPCVGAGHFLSYAFDLLMEIYRECGWTDAEAARSVAENNLYGLDIDDRVVRLARLAVVMKATQYGACIRQNEIARHILALQDTARLTEEDIRTAAGDDEGLYAEWCALCGEFSNAAECGSMITVGTHDLTALRERIVALSESKDSAHIVAAQRLAPLVAQAEILSDVYDVVATNPPYMNKYSPDLKAYIQQHFAAYKGDLFSVMMVRCFDLCKESGYLGFMTPNVWMFLKSYEELRRRILYHKTITTLVQMAKGAFFKEATVDVCAFVLANTRRDENGLYIRLENFRGDMDTQNQQMLKVLAERDDGCFYEVSPEKFRKLPWLAIGYWLSDGFVRAFAEHTAIGDIAGPRQGLATGCNERFVRLWHEVPFASIGYAFGSTQEAAASHIRWFPYNKGGEYRKWYGNDAYVVNWENDGHEIRHFKDSRGKLRSRPQNTPYYFRECISWSLVSSGAIAFRYKPRGFIFDVAGMSCFADKDLLYLLALCNSPIVAQTLALLAPTVNYQAGDIARIPVVAAEESRKEVIEALVRENIGIVREDWDAFETSWDFQKHPLV